MNDESRKIEEASQNFSLKLAIGVCALLLLIGFYIYLVKGLAFLDLTMLPYIAVFLVFTVLGFLALKKEGGKKGFLFAALAVGVLVISSVKIGWQNDRYNADEPFVFYHHTNQFPSWEGYLLNPIIKQPNWILFAKECGVPALKNQSTHEACSSYASIQNRYHINAKQELDDYYALMQRTAALINKRGTMNAGQYRSCIMKKECAEIPLLPVNVNPDEIEDGDDQYNYIARPFWHLVENEPINKELCDYITICRVLYKTGAVKFE